MTSKNEVEKNYEAFKKELPKLLKKKSQVGKFSIWSNQKLIKIYPTFSKAVEEAVKQFPKGNFSIQEITDKPIQLGFASLCL